MYDWDRTESSGDTSATTAPDPLASIDPDTQARLGLGVDDKGKPREPVLSHLSAADAQLVADAIGGRIEPVGVAFAVVTD